MAIKIPQSMTDFGVDRALEYVCKNPEANLPTLMEFVDKFSTETTLKDARDFIRPIVKDPTNVWYKYVVDLFKTVDVEILKTLYKNFIMNASVEGRRIQQENEKKYGCNIPWAILMDPTSACNLHCTGCWAATYGNKLNMDFALMDNIVTQGKELGIKMYLFSGGEPLVRKADIIALCNKHSDCMFTSFTNSLLIDEKFADDMLRVKNFIPAISVEGFEEATDFRRGKGTFKGIMHAMDLLKERKLPFGVSCCYTSKNTDDIGSEAYFDAMVEWGAKFGWFFTYMPVGKAAVPELIASPEQRKFMYDRIREFRKTKPIFTMDFWNDGEFVGGCIAGGRRYCHINANGDIEPCAFIHYSDSNIRDTTLLEAFQKPLFMGYRAGQPFNKNMLQPCPMFDNPHCLQKIVHESGAHSTDLEAPEPVDELIEKTLPAAEKWAPVAKEIWEHSKNGKKALLAEAVAAAEEADMAKAANQ